MLTSTFMIGFSILMTYALAIGACMAILQSEFLKKGYIWFYRILIALNVIGITVFIEKCFTVEKIRRELFPNICKCFICHIFSTTSLDTCRFSEGALQ